jgi:hypothetical protein
MKLGKPGSFDVTCSWRIGKLFFRAYGVAKICVVFSGIELGSFERKALSLTTSPQQFCLNPDTFCWFNFQFGPIISRLRAGGNHSGTSGLSTTGLPTTPATAAATTTNNDGPHQVLLSTRCQRHKTIFSSLMKAPNQLLRSSRESLLTA